MNADLSSEIIVERKRYVCMIKLALSLVGKHLNKVISEVEQ